MEYIKKDIPLYSVTIWDKKFNGVEKEWQPKTIKYKYLLSDELDSIKVDKGDIRILYTGKDVGFTNDELAGDAVSDGEIVSIPWGGIPTVKYYKGRFVTGDNRIATSSDKSLLLNEYLYFYMKGNLTTIASFYRGASLKHPSMRDVLKMKISLPDIKEQDKVVKELRSIEQLLDKLNQKIELLDELVKARFVEMFGNEKNTQKLGDLVSICRGASPRPISSYTTKDEDGENWIKIGDVEENDIYINHAAEKVTKAGADKSRRVKVGDFILSNSMSFGRPYILNIDGCVHDGWLIISDYERSFEQLFLYYLLRSDDVQAQFNGTVSGAVVKNLNSDKVRETKVIVPSKDKQKEFVEFSKQIDKSKFISILITIILYKQHYYSHIR